MKADLELKEVIFSTTVTKIGKDADALLQANQMLILFGDDAPEILQDVCFMHSSKNVVRNIQAGDTVKIEDRCYPVLRVGSVACETLRSLGHCTLHFVPEDDSEILEGTIYLRGEALPVVQEGTKIEVLSM